MTLPASAEVVVVGAGVMGASVAYHLARRGQRNVLLLDAAQGPGGGSTSRATGGYRAQYATAVNVKLSLLSREKLLAFRDETGVDCGYAQVGYLWLASTPEQLETLLDGQRVQHANGLPEARAVSLEEIRALNPALSMADVVGGVFGPTDGTIRPLAILNGYLAAAQRLGVNVVWGTRVTGL
ncbi:MAG: FAD-binding oxidoreductase, partial [Acidobacteria bacterium]|nr:FAD-binding oxidoreductase [Acidobacteriota bacterium]